MLLALIKETAGVFHVVDSGPIEYLFPDADITEITDEFLIQNNAAIIDEDWRPNINSEYQYLQRVNPYVLEEDHVVTYDAGYYSEEEIKNKVTQPYLDLDYAAFWQDLIRSEIYSALKSAAQQSLKANVLATELISIFSDAKNSNLDIDAMQYGIWETAAALNDMNPELLSVLNSLMIKHGLDIYTIVPAQTSD